MDIMHWNWSLLSWDIVSIWLFVIFFLKFVYCFIRCWCCCFLYSYVNFHAFSQNSLTWGVTIERLSICSKKIRDKFWAKSKLRQRERRESRRLQFVFLRIINLQHTFAQCHIITIIIWILSAALVQITVNNSFGQLIRFGAIMIHECVFGWRIWFPRLRVTATIRLNVRKFSLLFAFNVEKSNTHKAPTTFKFCVLCLTGLVFVKLQTTIYTSVAQAK